MLTAGLIAAMAYALLCLWLYLGQRSLIYYPTPYLQPEEGESVALATMGAVLNLWVLRRPGPDALVYFGGNAEAVSLSMRDFARALPDRTLVFVNYRGYGGSSGHPSETALVADALAIFDAFKLDYPDIAVIGRSLGSGVAVQLAAQRPVSKLVLVTPFDTLVRVGQAAFPWLPVSLLARERFESVRFAPMIGCRVLVLIAADDEVIASSRGQALAASFAAGRATTVTVSGAGHNDIQLWPPYYEQVARFVEAPKH